MDQVRAAYKHEERRRLVTNENVTSEPTCISLCFGKIDLHSDLEDGSCLDVRHRGRADKNGGRNVAPLSSLLLLLSATYLLAMPPLSPSILFLVDVLQSRHLRFMLQSRTLPGFTSNTERKLQK